MHERLRLLPVSVIVERLAEEKPGQFGLDPGFTVERTGEDSCIPRYDYPPPLLAEFGQPNRVFGVAFKARAEVLKVMAVGTGEAKQSVCVTGGNTVIEEELQAAANRRSNFTAASTAPTGT